MNGYWQSSRNLTNYNNSMDDEVTIEADGSEELGGIAGKPVEAKLAKLKVELERTKQERQEYLDGWQRAKADYVNALKRVESDLRSAATLGQTKAIMLFMPALDSLAQARASGEEIPAGFEAIARQLDTASKSIGLTTIGVVGEQFDPTLHEALGQDPVDSMDKDDVVTAVLQTGWKANDSVIRPAKVRVGHFEV